MDNIKVRDLPQKSVININDRILVEDNDGTKTAQVKDFKSVLSANLFFDTLTDLKAALLTDGDTCVTLGFKELDDGGGATYKIKYNPADKANGKSSHYLDNSDTLRAYLVDSPRIYVDQLGAHGDGINDDIDVIRYAMSTGKEVIFDSSKSYKITESIRINKGQKIKFNGCKLVPSYCTAIVVSGQTIKNRFVEISNFTIDCTSGGSGIFITDDAGCVNIENFVLEKLVENSVGINITNAHDVSIRNGIISSDSTTVCKGIGIKLNSIDSEQIKPDLDLYNICVDNVYTKFLETAVNIINTTEAMNMNFDNCTFMSITSETTPTYGFYIASKCRNINISNQTIIKTSSAIHITSSTTSVISVRNLYVWGINYIHTQMSNNCKYILEGYQSYLQKPATDIKGVVFKMVKGTVYIQTGCINLGDENYSYKYDQADKNDYSGTINNIFAPEVPVQP